METTAANSFPNLVLASGLTFVETCVFERLLGAFALIPSPSSTYPYSPRELQAVTRALRKVITTAWEAAKNLGSSLFGALDANLLIYPSSFHFHVRICIMIWVTYCTVKRTLVAMAREVEWRQQAAAWRRHVVDAFLPRLDLSATVQSFGPRGYLLGFDAG